MSIATADNYLKVLESKAAYLTDMLNMTGGLKKTDKGSMEDAEAYIILLNKREQIFEKIKMLDSELQAWGAPDKISNSADFLNAVKKAQAGIKDLISKFLEADKKASLLANEISAGLTTGIKGINNGRTVNQMYQENTYSGMTSFDKSK